jgi:hypothetical protein
MAIGESIELTNRRDSARFVELFRAGSAVGVPFSGVVRERYTVSGVCAWLTKCDLTRGGTNGDGDFRTADCGECIFALSALPRLVSPDG